ncbi:PhoH family protein [Magnetospira sp. QH-2]|uniref:PhoH family protein n=1 Tax=Magnetospira sp. (strain QH-2) TaxID=1288970 RepID=UPI0003E819EF|nr:PhoH family protein [Magnetospira sp. QH-2]CCQ75709.1 putative PhoH-like protein(phosphate starvation-inducible protein, with ATP binding activity) [Magnetospira sp. QH-2]
MPPVTPQDPFDPNSGHLVLSFDNNDLARTLFGAEERHLKHIEKTLKISCPSRGNMVALAGPPEKQQAAADVLNGLYDRLERKLSVGLGEVEAALRMVAGGVPAAAMDVQVSTRKRTLSPRSPTQATYLKAIDDQELVFGVGPAGTGKTYLAVAKAVERLIAGEVDRIILSRPAVEAGEQLGFLPGDMREKVDPYLRPLYDALNDMMPADQVEKRLEKGEIEVAPLAFMRGRTLSNAFVILDEAQNTTAVQMKMFLTRLGQGSRMVITGDLTQVDLPRGIRSGLRDALEVLDGVEGVAVTRFQESDVVRHNLVTRIVRAYNHVESRRKASAPYEQE